MPRTSMLVTISLLLAIPTVCTQEHTSTQAVAQEGAQERATYVHVPTTISEEWQAQLRQYTDPALIPEFPSPDDLDGWREFQQAMEAGNMAFSEMVLRQFEPTVTERVIGEVPVIDVKPKGWRDNGKALLYTHGGAYVLGSARASLASSTLVAQATGLHVVSVDYTLAPEAKWQEVTDQVLAVFEGLQEDGYSLRDLAIYGDSAGGGLAAAAVLKMRNRDLGMPAAVVLWSPWVDITDNGDTYATLKDAEPMYRYEEHLKPSADAYADPDDQKNPYVSPVYGDYSKGFPPTLIQGGTKEIFLSNFVRLYQTLDMAGQTVKLDLYEGMPHVFQVMLADSPESRTAIGKVGSFLKQHLGG